MKGLLGEKQKGVRLGTHKSIRLNFSLLVIRKGAPAAVCANSDPWYLCQQNQLSTAHSSPPATTNNSNEEISGEPVNEYTQGVLVCSLCAKGYLTWLIWHFKRWLITNLLYGLYRSLQHRRYRRPIQRLLVRTN